MKNKGLLVVLSGPSGAGKGTICKGFMEKYKENTRLSISATTRKPRKGEVDGVHYRFLTEEGFKELADGGGFIEWACFCGNCYGTPKKEALEMLESGKDVILEIEVQGAMQVKQSFPEAVLVFVLPPSKEELKNRLIGRQTESMEVIEERLNTALKEITYVKEYDYILLNDKPDMAIECLAGILDAERQKVLRCEEIISEFK